MQSTNIYLIICVFSQIIIPDTCNEDIFVRLVYTIYIIGHNDRITCTQCQCNPKFIAI